MNSRQALSEADRRAVAAWAADCAERVLAVFEAEAPGDDRPRDAIARTRAFARGELGAAGEIRRRFVAGRAAREVRAPAAVAAARAAAQASAVAHMGAHALGATRTPRRPPDWQPLTVRRRSARRSVGSLASYRRQRERRYESCRQSARIRQVHSGRGCSLPAFSAPSSVSSKPGWPPRRADQIRDTLRPHPVDDRLPRDTG